MNRHFILINQTVYETDDLAVAIANTEHWNVACTTVKGVTGPVEISTAFLGQDGQMFETMILGGGTALEGMQFRDQTYAAAIQTHASLVDGQRKARAAHMRNKRLAAKRRT